MNDELEAIVDKKQQLLVAHEFVKKEEGKPSLQALLNAAKDDSDDQCQRSSQPERGI